MNESIRLVLSLSLSGSILAAVIFVLKPFVRYKLPKSVQYYLWLVVLLRLVIPFSFEESIMNNIFYDEQVLVGITAQGAAPAQGNTGSDAADSALLPNVGEKVANGAYNYDTDHSRYLKDLFNQYALYTWLLGVIIVLAVDFIGYARFSKCLKKSNRPASAEQNKILTGILSGQKKIMLVRNPFVTTPMLKGIIKPCIIIPDSDYEEGQLKNILLHELSHMKRFDIAVKWLTMMAAAIHWFNPAMYFIQREINHACELACDELVVKNFNAAEKQAYGDTLLAVAAEHKYPAGVLQATMCEEKTNLKERLIAIMKHGKKSGMIAAASSLLLVAAVIGAVVLGAGVGNNGTSPPNIYINAEGENAKEALMGSYSWSYRNVHVEADSDHPMNFKYGPDNIVNAASAEQLIIGTQKLKLDKKYDFTIDQISIYKDKQLVEPFMAEPDFMNGSLYLQTPREAGEYVYCLVLNFKDKGTVNYGFVVRVDMVTYDLEEISKYRTRYVGDHTKVLAVAGSIPVPDKDFRQQYISMITSSKPYKLTVYYEAKQNDTNRSEWAIEKPDTATYSDLEGNALVVLCMIDNLDEVTFAFRKSRSEGALDESKYDTTYTFSRAAFEEKYGDLTALGGNLERLERALAEN